MKIINLMEDTKGKGNLLNEHGLCIYIETNKHKLLVDTGASEKSWRNAEKLGIKIEDIDTVFLSHGHYDHSGGIMSFCEINKKAKIYIHKNAIYDYFNLRDEKEKYIGIDKRIINLDNLILIDDFVKIDEEISVFSNVIGRRKWPLSNLILKKKVGNEYIQDSFDHEQYIVINDNDKKILISGCAHNGILNILDKFRDLYNHDPDMVISGFHMMKNDLYDENEINLIRETAKELSGLKTHFYTGHCTGLPAFDLMKEIMKEQLNYMHSGDTLI